MLATNQHPTHTSILVHAEHTHHAYILPLVPSLSPPYLLSPLSTSSLPQYLLPPPLPQYLLPPLSPQYLLPPPSLPSTFSLPSSTPSLAYPPINTPHSDRLVAGGSDKHIGVSWTGGQPTQLSLTMALEEDLCREGQEGVCGVVWCVCVHAHVCVWCVCGVYVCMHMCVMSLAHLHFIPTLDQFDNFITLCPNEDLALKSTVSHAGDTSDYWHSAN